MVHDQPNKKILLTVNANNFSKKVNKIFYSLNLLLILNLDSLLLIDLLPFSYNYIYLFNLFSIGDTFKRSKVSPAFQSTEPSKRFHNSKAAMADENFGFCQAPNASSSQNSIHCFQLQRWRRCRLEKLAVNKDLVATLRLQSISMFCNAWKQVMMILF